MKQFLYTTVCFTLLGTAFKYFVLVDRLTDVRPVNAIHLVAVLLFGPVGGLGFIGNFLAPTFQGNSGIFSEKKNRIFTVSAM